MKRITTSQFIERSTAVHGGKYDYTNTTYVNTYGHVDILCPTHGAFSQVAKFHMRGSGCRLCTDDATRLRLTMTTETFISKSQKMHDNKYDYSNTVLVSYHEKLSICCDLHGEFKQTPWLHLRGSGCPMCGHEATGVKNSHTASEFISLGKKKHGECVDYSKVEYVHCNTPVTLICPQHGEFEQTPLAHLRGEAGGCVACWKDRCTSNTAEFITKSQLVHGDKYDYSKAHYTASSERVSIICPKHGTFEQLATSHLSGCGCIKCTKVGGYNFDRLSTDSDLIGVMGHLYVVKMQNDEETFIKVGITRSLVSRRVAELSSSPYNATVLCTAKLLLLNAFIVEQNTINIHTSYRPTTRFSGHTECLTLSDIELADLCDTVPKLTDDMDFTLV